MSVTQSYYFFIGTMAEYIKLFPVMESFQQKHIPFKVIATGQNEIRSVELSKFSGFIDPYLLLSNGPRFKSPLGLLVWFLKTLVKSVLVLRNTFHNQEVTLIVHGDTVSTLMGAVMGKLMGARVAHIEAGLRSFNFFNPFPEEIDRVLTSRLVDLHFCPNQWSVDNLLNHPGEKIDTGNNTLIDSLTFALTQPKSDAIKKLEQPHPYFICVIHRQENLLDRSLLLKLLRTIIRTSRSTRCIFILHPLTRSYLEKYRLLDSLMGNSNIKCINKQSYFDMVQLMSKATFIITDGGSNQEEAYYLGLPCLIVRKCTERIEGLGKNVVLSGLDFTNIRAFVSEYKKYRTHIVHVNKRPSEVIRDYLTNHKQIVKSN